MSLTSPAFLAVFLVSIPVFYLVPKEKQWLCLLVYSVLFFGFFAPVHTGAYLIASVAITTISVRLIVRYKEAGDSRNARIAVVIGIAGNLFFLALLKYCNFVIDNLNAIAELLHAPMHLGNLGLLAPLGISFYTMQVIAYLLDSYWGMCRPQTGFLKTMLFIGYFPQLTSGPIARYSEMEKQLYEGRQFNDREVVSGLFRMLWGIFKKLVIASRLGVIVNTIYADPSNYDGFYIWIAAALFMLWLYADFSGCMDIIIGASQCYGIKLPENFRTPFFSKSVQEFWQRWHITLGAWMRDYVMYPMLRSETVQHFTEKIKARHGKKAAKEIPSYVCMLGVWLLMGVWHGGGWNYILGQGLWFGGCIILSRILGPYATRLYARFRINTNSFCWQLLQCLGVFALVCIGNIFFQIKSLTDAIRTIGFGFSHFNPQILVDGSLFRLGLSKADFYIASLGVILQFTVSCLQSKIGSIRIWLAGHNRILRWSVALCLVLSIIVFGEYGPGFDAKSFIYQGF